MPKIHLNSKTIARIAAIQTIYQLQSSDNNVDIETLLLNVISFYKDKDVKKDHEIDKDISVKLKPSINYLKELVTCTYNNLQELDKIISEYLLKTWTLDSLPPLLLSTLRVSICEIKYFPQTPRNVIINEYTDISNNMLDSGEVGFINSVLDKYASTKR